MRKETKAKKDFLCSSCKRAIRTGDMYDYYSYREPMYKGEIMGDVVNFVKSGYQYMEYRLCQHRDCPGHVREEV